MANYCEVFQKRSSLIMYILGCLCVIGLGYFYMHNAVELSNQCNPIRGCCFEDPMLYSFFGSGLMGYFGLCILVFTVMLIRPYKIFYLNDDGFWAKDYGFVRWDQVTKLYLDNISYQTAIFFNVKDDTKLKFTLHKKIARIFEKGDFHVELSTGFNDVNEVFKLMKPHCNLLLDE